MTFVLFTFRVGLELSQPITVRGHRDTVCYGLFTSCKMQQACCYEAEQKEPNQWNNCQDPNDSTNPGITPSNIQAYINTHTSTQASGVFSQKSALDLPWLAAVAVCASVVWRALSRVNTWHRSSFMTWETCKAGARRVASGRVPTPGLLSIKPWTHKYHNRSLCLTLKGNSLEMRMDKEVTCDGQCILSCCQSMKRSRCQSLCMETSNPLSSS